MQNSEVNAVPVARIAGRLSSDRNDESSPDDFVE